MLKLLNITNLAVINHLQVEFGEGLNILSGETGSGKSVILMALGLLLGERSSQDMLRTGETRAVVEGIFEIAGNQPLQELLNVSGIELDDEDLIIKREVVVNGRGKIFVNNQAATINLLKNLQPHIIDVHGQGEQQSLLSTAVQTYMLDAFGKAESVRNSVEDAFTLAKGLIDDLDSIKKSEAERLQMLDLVEYQIQEMESLQPKLNEDEELEAERRILSNAEKLTTLCAETLKLLYDDDESVLTKLGLSEKRINELSVIDNDLSACLEHINSAKYLIEDTTFTIRNYVDRVMYSPARLQVVEERLEILERVKRKYAKSLSEIMAGLEGLYQRRNDLRNSEEAEKTILNALQKALGEYAKAAKKLTTIRENAAKELSKKLKKDLSEVALEASQFIVYFNKMTSSLQKTQHLQLFKAQFGEISVNKAGEEIAEFYFTANKGEEPRALSAVASGGELSRLMLILKTNIAPTPYPRTLVFDEIDTGIGGRVADAVGVRLRKLAKSNQVICVTHQAQIARYAHCHLQVAKTAQGGRTTTTVARLERAGRVSELARMMAADGISAITLQHAEELLEKE